MMRIEDDAVAAFLREISFNLDGRDRVAGRRSTASRFSRLMAVQPGVQRVLDLIDGAQQSIFVESPYITFPFTTSRSDATRRSGEDSDAGQNNWRFFGTMRAGISALRKIDCALSGRHEPFEGHADRW